MWKCVVKDVKLKVAICNNLCHVKVETLVGMM